MKIKGLRARCRYPFALLSQQFVTCLAPTIVTLVVLGLTLSVISRPVQAEDADPQSFAKQLTQSLVALNARLKRANPTDRTQLLDDLLALAAERWVVLTALIEDNPGALLHVALPAQVRDSLPPMVQRYVEKHIQLEGRLEILHEDRGMGSRYIYFLKVDGKRFVMRFSESPPTHMLSDTRIRVVGVKLDQDLALASGVDSIEILALKGKGKGNGSGGTNTDPTSDQPNAFGEQRTGLFLVNFQDKPTEQPWTLDDAWNAVFGTTSDFFWENSYQQTWLSGDVYGWYTIPLNSTVCDLTGIASYAQQAAIAAGVDLSVYTRYIYAFPKNACGGLGAGTIGGNPSQAWINGSIELKVVGHEMGHNFGLYHSHGLECGTSVLGTNCSVFEYGDDLDSMGNTSAGHFNVFQKERLGWLGAGPSPPITTVQANGLYTVEPLEVGNSGPKGLAILKSIDPTTDQQTWYYVEYRQAIGFDSFLAANSNILNGVVVHTGSPSNADSSYLLDMTPASGSQNWSDWSDPALEVGQSFYDPDSGVTITSVSVSSTDALVSVSFGSSACVHTNPTVALSPSQSPSVLAGATVLYTAMVTNNDDASCEASSFDMQATGPDGWIVELADVALNIDPGESVFTTLQVVSLLSESDGAYTVEVIATNSADPTYVASSLATYVIGAGLDITVSTDQSAYNTNESVNVTAEVTLGGSPLVGVTVTFGITDPNGAVRTKTTTTQQDGQTTYQFRLKKNDPTGFYQVSAEASSNGASGEGNTGFMVQ